MKVSITARLATAISCPFVACKRKLAHVSLCKRVNSPFQKALSLLTSLVDKLPCRRQKKLDVANWWNKLPTGEKDRLSNQLTNLGSILDRHGVKTKTQKNLDVANWWNTFSVEKKELLNNQP